MSATWLFPPQITSKVTFGKGWGVGLWPLLACVAILALAVRSAPVLDGRPANTR
jgi:hypothetical protein